MTERKPTGRKPNRDLRKRRLSDKEEPKRQERDSFSECGCRGEICRKYRQRYLRAKTEAPRKADGRSLIKQEGRFQQAEAETKNLSGKCSAKADRKLKFNFVRTRAVKTLGKVKPGKSEIY